MVDGAGDDEREGLGVGAAKFKRPHADQPQPEEIHAIRLAWEDAEDLAA